jgi:TIR domain
MLRKTRRTGVAEQRLVFVSHSGEDTWVAKWIAHVIETTTGARAFLAAIDIDVGAEFENELRAALQRAHELVVLITPWAFDQTYVSAEVTVAWFRDILIVPVLIGVTSADLHGWVNVPVLLKARSHVRLSEIAIYLEQLRRRVYEQTEGVTNG